MNKKTNAPDHGQRRSHKPKSIERGTHANRYATHWCSNQIQRQQTACSGRAINPRKIPAVNASSSHTSSRRPRRVSRPSVCGWFARSCAGRLQNIWHIRQEREIHPLSRSSACLNAFAWRELITISSSESGVISNPLPFLAGHGISQLGPDTGIGVRPSSNS